MKSILLHAKNYVIKNRNADPSGTIIDSQSVKGIPESVEDTGFDGGKGGF